jgi:thiamine-phosphate pyrophosphorylase
MNPSPIQPLEPASLRARIADARLMLIFTPELVEHPYAAVASALPHVDVVQVRPKAAGQGGGPSEAQACLDATRRVLALCADLFSNSATEAPLVTVDDRADVARVLWDEGCAGVHLGRNDQPARDAREVLGPGPLIGLSTHDALQVAIADEEPVDSIGFGPIFATPTKGLTSGVGVEAAWVATQATDLPLFAIGGIDAGNVQDLGRIGRVAVASAILNTEDPGRAAMRLRELLLAAPE